MAVGDAYVFPGFLTPVLTQLFFPKPATTFLICSCRGERRKYAGKKSRLNRGSNSQPPGHESDTLTTEPPWQGFRVIKSQDCVVKSMVSQTTDFKLPNQKSLQTTILNLMKIAESSLNGQVTLWVKEKLLITSNFSISHSVFKRLVSSFPTMFSIHRNLNFNF